MSSADEELSLLPFRWNPVNNLISSVQEEAYLIQ